MLCNNHDRHTWDLSVEVDAGASTVAEQYVDHRFPVPMGASKTILSGTVTGAATLARRVVPEYMLEREGASPPTAVRATPRAGARPLTAPAVTVAGTMRTNRKLVSENSDPGTCRSEMCRRWPYLVARS